jgi:hypothetical protein
VRRPWTESLSRPDPVQLGLLGRCDQRLRKGGKGRACVRVGPSIGPSPSDLAKKLSKAIQRGIPSTLRGIMWQLMSSSKDPDLEQVYSSLLKQTSSHEKAISRDLSRTFPNHEYFKEGGVPGTGTGQENLFNVVKAYSLYDEEVGYCQGLQFIVGPLLLNVGLPVREERH